MRGDWWTAAPILVCRRTYKPTSTVQRFLAAMTGVGRWRCGLQRKWNNSHVCRDGDKSRTAFPMCFPSGLVQVRDVGAIAIIQQCRATLIAADHTLSGL